MNRLSESTWVYFRSEPGLWTVGFYEPDGKWQPESDHSSETEAATRVHYLNGGSQSALMAAVPKLLEILKRICAEHARLCDLGRSSGYLPLDVAIAEAEGVIREAERA